MNENTKKKVQIAAGAAVVVVAVVVYVLVEADKVKPPQLVPRKQLPIAEATIKKFTSEEDFKAYLTKSQTATAEDFSLVYRTPLRGQLPEFGGGGGDGDYRYSETNVQVSGIDEPDRVKTDGRNIFISRQEFYVYDDFALSPRPPQSLVQIVNAFPVNNLRLQAGIKQFGDLLLKDNTLVVLSFNALFGYDVSNPSSPREVWKLELPEATELVQVRQFGEHVYLVIKNFIEVERPCPVVPLKQGGRDIAIPCREIYYPTVPISDAATYTVFQVNLKTGQAEKSLSFVGSGFGSVVYMSPQALYITYEQTADTLSVINDFLKEQGAGLFPAETIARIKAVLGYEISEQSKLSEIVLAVERYLRTLSPTERTAKEEEIASKADDYAVRHMREMVKTGIVKIPLAGFDEIITGSVPGTVLNQYSLDEYQDHLRLATTVGERTVFFFSRQEATANDVYVLDSQLNTVGSVQDLGLEERIYSTRFIGDKGYVVTFRQIDPFYVLDLADPETPRLAGELKLPGFSSYLHPLTDNLILGVGQEVPADSEFFDDIGVKLSLFDVSDPKNPRELSSRRLDAFWSEVEGNPRAFLQDRKFEVFFLPADNKGYVISYKGGQLIEQKVIPDFPRRAVYIGDYLYAISDNAVRVFQESDWSEIASLEFSG